MTITATAPRAAAYRGRLRWWTELPLVAVIYALYSGARLLVRGDVDDAVEHGADILHLEQLLHLDPEHFFNQLFTDHAFLGVPADFAYASLHYIVTPGILVWLWLRRPTAYRNARTWLLISTLIGLIGFTLLPTAPPRLIGGGHGFIDTMAQYGSYGWWGTDASAPRGLGHLTNEYAAMPSLHFGWSLWCGIMLFRYGRHTAVRVLGVLYPLITALVVMGTANHYLLDVLAGGTVMLLGFLLAPQALRLVDVVRARAGVALGRPPRVAPAEAGAGGLSATVPGPRRAPGKGADAHTGGDASADGSGSAPGSADDASRAAETGGINTTDTTDGIDDADLSSAAVARGGEHAGHGRMS
ncbi:phosphatase PAP2 family protein [Actinacidiphila rubida]|uniref:PAP2 superfamily protein n=1 Tax=Actinacidiphila rubida TaxID=310780 RepID=A0A1H8I116_9ACTN|nr:phosphatase PAP2 family protein [Actinacidiphila rubida]SEN61796.1 PAP2 superfamily protein [Actinacidiphila rubida]